MMADNRKAEFRPGEDHRYDLSSAPRWIFSHLAKYPALPLLAILCSIINNVGYSGIQLLIGRGFDVLAKPGWKVAELALVAVLIGAAAIGQGLAGLGRNVAFEFLAQRIERDARAELFASLLGKSQTFHSRQRVGDIMARSTNDVHYLNMMFSPGISLIIDSGLTALVPLAMVATIDPRLLLVPLIFIGLLVLTVWEYNRRLNPATDDQRQSFGELNAGLEDALEGIETVKANLGEEREIGRFISGAGKLRDLYIKIARIQAKYWPLLVFAVCWALGLLHALLLWRSGAISLGQVVSYMLLYSGLRFATFISLWSFNLLQMGLSSADRILALIKDRGDLDENPRGRSARLEGRVEFREVSFAFSESGHPVLSRLSFSVDSGQTVAIVGRTGAGKTSLVRLVNRIFDVSEGSVMVDGVDVRDWSLESLRSQISTVEQDVFLYSRSIAENIAFGVPDASREKIEAAARAAQAHDFIMGFDKGYETMVGERGVTLSGGQKQRIAIARAFLVDPRILILDDSTSAVDSRTEAEIQKAMRAAAAGRTTFLITHRLSQIRWADRILIIERGRLADAGSHEQLLARSEDYRRLFARL